MTAGEMSANREKLKKSSFVKGASEALNSRFSDMFKAFQYVDLDRSGTLDWKEIRRALDMWNMPVDDAKLAELIAACDYDGDGQVDYKEFVDVLARDTVAPAALGKRDMQASDAMGIDEFAKAKVKNVRASIND
jgi:Ca2+-binding EF-hand superfamily protein